MSSMDPDLAERIDRGEWDGTDLGIGETRSRDRPADLETQLVIATAELRLTACALSEIGKGCPALAAGLRESMLVGLAGGLSLEVGAIAERLATALKAGRSTEVNQAPPKSGEVGLQSRALRRMG